MYMTNYLTQLIQIAELTAAADGLLICNKQGRIEYAHTLREFPIIDADVIGQHISTLYPALTEDTSTIMQVLKTGIPIITSIKK